MPRPLQTQTLLRIVSVAAILLAAVHLVFPKLAIDSTTVLLLALAVLPWLSPFLKSIELPGGVKLDFREAEKRLLSEFRKDRTPRGKQQRSPMNAGSSALGSGAN